MCNHQRLVLKSVVVPFGNPVQNIYNIKIHLLWFFIIIKKNCMSKTTTMEIVHPHAAGIDVGSRSHFVAIGQGKEDVKEFGVYNEDLSALTQWLLDNDITHAAMESTGSYWQTLFATLQEAGISVTLCNGKFTKNIKGKKTDVIDC